MEALPLLLPLAVVGVAVLVRAVMQSSATSPWQDVARRLGLRFEPGGMLQSPKIQGTLGGFAVSVEVLTRGSGNSRSSYTQVVVDTYGRVPDDIALASETFWSALDIMGDAIDVGDPHFDDLVKVRGVESTLLAVLDAKARQLVRTYIKSDGGVVKGGRLTSERSGRERKADVLEERIRRMASIGDRLSIRRDDVPNRMADNVAEDLIADVRLRNLKYLCTYYRRSNACDRAATAALEDEDVRVRLLAARTLGPRGVTTLEGIVADQRVADDLRNEALDLLAERLPRDDLRKVIARLLADKVLLLTALRITERESLRELASAVVGLTRSGDALVATAAARALGTVGDTSSTNRLVALLQHANDPVKVAACGALGRVGSLDAVEPLLEHTKGLFKDGDLKRAARQAVDAIQSRAGGADGGRLSVVDSPDEGALSVADRAGAGALSAPGGGPGDGEPS